MLTSKILLASAVALAVVGSILAFLVAGAPAIVGTWIGGFVTSPLASVVFFSIGAGAVFHVVIGIARFAAMSGGRFLTGSGFAGITTGMFVMYLTTLLI